MQRFANGLHRSEENNNATKCTEIMERVMADVHPFSVYDIYADACPADGKGRGRAGAVTGQLSRALGGLGGGGSITGPLSLLSGCGYLHSTEQRSFR